MKIGVLTSTRADYGIYYSLLKAMNEEEGVDFGLFVFGTHLSEEHGATVQLIEQDGYPIYERIVTVPSKDDAEGVSRAMAVTMAGFASAWAHWEDQLDVVVALGDRYEMFAAVAALVPFGVPVAHLHGGETSLGAIDDKFRHAITQMAQLHFTATPAYAAKVAQLKDSSSGVYHVGAPSLDGLEALPTLSISELYDRFGIDFSLPSILVTFHPETVARTRNEAYGNTLCSALMALTNRYQIVITMPNADTMGSVLRKQFTALAERDKRVVTIESFGKIGYFSAMQHCAFLLGNTSSGIIEAASFGKYAIDLGERQLGRAHSHNLIKVAVNKAEILEAIAQLEARGLTYEGGNVYVEKGNAADNILNVLKDTFSNG